MKALSIPQPLADLFADGMLWAYSSSSFTEHRGDVLIHAGQYSGLLSLADLKTSHAGSLIALAQLTLCVEWELVVSQALRTDRVAECCIGCNRTWGEIRQEPHHKARPYVWVMENVQRLETPIPCRGHSGLFNVDVSAEARVRSLMTRV